MCALLNILAFFPFMKPSICRDPCCKWCAPQGRTSTGGDKIRAKSLRENHIIINRKATENPSLNYHSVILIYMHVHADTHKLQHKYNVDAPVGLSWDKSTSKDMFSAD